MLCRGTDAVCALELFPESAVQDRACHWLQGKLRAFLGRATRKCPRHPTLEFPHRFCSQEFSAFVCSTHLLQSHIPLFTGIPPVPIHQYPVLSIMAAATSAAPRERKPSTSAPISQLQGPVGPGFSRPKHKRTATGFTPGEIKAVENSIPEAQREA